MVFNDTTNKQGIIQDIDFLLYGNSVTLNTAFSIEDRTRNVNIVWDEAVAELYRADPNYQWDDTTNADFPIATMDLSAGLDHYTMLDSALVINRVRIKDSNGKFKTLTPKLRREISDSKLEATGSPDSYYKMGGAIFPVPIPDYSSGSGVELEFQRGANHFVSTDTDKEPGFNSQFHQFLSVGAALRFAVANNMTQKSSQLSALKEQIRQKMVEHYERRSPDEKPKLRLKRRSVNNYGL